MGTNILKIVLLITATQFLFASSCKKDASKPCRDAQYSFNVTSEFSPQQETYNLGDTIFLNSSFPKSLVNLISNQQVDYSNSLGVGGNFNFIYMDTITKTIQESLNKFSVSAIKGLQLPITNSPNLGLSVSYLESSSNYELKFSVKLLARGLYYIGLTDLSSQGIRGQNCTNAGFNMTVINTNKHFNLFQYALNYYPDALLQKSIYCFRVQ